ncbi:MAG: hypothetical protein R3F34_11560 [Planctomycetota bacterium]
MRPVPILPLAALLLIGCSHADDAAVAAATAEMASRAEVAAEHAPVPDALADLDAVVVAENAILEQTLAILRSVGNDREAKGAREALRAIAKQIPRVRERRSELESARSKPTDARAFAREVAHGRRLRSDVGRELGRLGDVDGARTALEGELEPILRFLDGK